MTDRRRARLSDWLNGGVGVVMIGTLSWAGVKLVDVREDVAFVKAKVEGETHLIKALKEDTEKNADNIEDHGFRLVKIETTLGLKHD